MKFYADYRALYDALNPEWSKAAAQDIFSFCEVTNNLLRNFDVYEEIYANVGPNTDVYPVMTRSIIEQELGRSIDVALKLVMLIPKALVKVSSRTPIRVAVRFHGGGVSTGSHCFLQAVHS
jgi:hypothetical protein